MTRPRLSHHVHPCVHRVTTLILSVFLGVAPLLLFAFVLMPKAAAGPPPGPALAPGHPLLNPVRNTHAAPATTTVSIHYDTTIDPGTVSPRTFAVHAMQTGQLLRTYGVHGGTILLTPTQPLKPGELVQASATTGTLDRSGQGPAAPTGWQFRAKATGGSGFFADTGQSPSLSQTHDVALGDLDGDGDLDAFFGNSNHQGNQAWFNDGTGTLTDSGRTLSFSNTFGVALGDLDGDGDLDVFVANHEQPNRAWFNSGNGVLKGHHTLGVTDTSSWAAALGDLDGDGDLDALIANGLMNNALWVNDGKGDFGHTPRYLSTIASRDVALGDLDGDGDLDAFFANEGDNQVWLNDGSGHLSDSAQRLHSLLSRNQVLGDRTLGSPLSWGVALGDLDGDGDLDAFVANFGPNTVWVNDGRGRFTDSGQALGGSTSWGVELADVDGDGDLDACVANSGPNKIWLNDGTGNLEAGQDLGNSNSQAVTLGDLTGNGALDALVANPDPNQTNKVWKGLYPQIVLRKTVGTVDNECAITDTIGVPPGTQVTYCYQVTNTGNVTLTTHTLTDSELGEIIDDTHALPPGEAWSVTRSAKLEEPGKVVNTALWTASAGALVARATATATVGVVNPEVQINHIIPNPSWFLEDVEFNGSGTTDTVTAFLDEYEWTRIPITQACRKVSGTLFGTAARIVDNTTPPGDHRICLRGRVHTAWSDYDTMTMTVRADRHAQSDIAVGPRSVSFWTDPEATAQPVDHPDVGDTVFARIEVANISLLDTPDEVTVAFYDGPISGPLHGPISGTLVATDTIDSIADRTSQYVIIPWTIGGEVGYRSFGVDVNYTENIPYFEQNPLPPWSEPWPESDYTNNRATAAVPVGRVTGTYAISVTARVDPLPRSRLYAGHPAYVRGKANYAWDVLLATMGATTTVEISDLSGGVVTYWETYQTRTTSPIGEYQATVQLPPAPGTYTATVTVDDGNLIGAHVVAFEVLAPPVPLPDLYIQRYSVQLSGPNTYIRHWQEYTPQRVHARSMLFGVLNEPVTITAQVVNGGTAAAAGDFDVSFYDGPPGGGDLIGRETVLGLAKGARQEVALTWTPAVTGRHLIQVVVDEAEQIEELNELNNYDSYYYRYQLCFNGIVGNCHHRAHRDVIDVRPAGPDLRALGLDAEAPVISDTITMAVHVYNVGHASIAANQAFDVTVYDGYPDISNTRTLHTQRLHGPMVTGTQRSFDVAWDTGVTGTVPGLHHICVDVDAGKEIAEELEENNLHCWNVYVYPPEADLYPYKVTFSPKCPLPNTDLDITAWFVNRGAEAFTGAATATITSEHGLNATTQLAGTILGRGGTGGTTVTWTTPSTHGTTYIHVEYWKESGYNRGPHRYAERLNICQNPKPDLHLLSEDIHLSPRSPIEGAPVDVSATIANLGRSEQATATGFLVEFHTTGPMAGYHRLGQVQTVSGLEPGGTVTISASEPLLMDDPFYAVQVSAWPQIEQDDANYQDNEATTSILQKDAVLVDLRITVGTEAGVCADTSDIGAIAGSEVFYCYRMTNLSPITLHTHDLRDSQLGEIFKDLAYSLKPGQSLERIKRAVIADTTENTATWTASTDPYTFTTQDGATVRVFRLYLPLIQNHSGE